MGSKDAAIIASKSARLSMSESPDFSGSMAAIGKYRQHISSDSNKVRRVDDILRRVERLSAQVDRLMALNNKLIENDEITESFDPETGTLTFSFHGITQSIVLNRADPDKPVQLLTSAMFGAYDANRKMPHSTAEADEIRTKLEDELESFYAQAHRVQKKVQYLFGLKKRECRKITIVRNNILEHPSDDITNTFGYGTNGPTLSPMRQGQSKFHDNGLISNVISFDKFLSEIFSEGYERKDK